MEDRLKTLAARARDVAAHADAAAGDVSSEMSELLQAMMAYRAAAVAYLAHPSVGDYVRFDAARYEGETREALERIAKLIDQLNGEVQSQSIDHPLIVESTAGSVVRRTWPS